MPKKDKAPTEVLDKIKKLLTLADPIRGGSAHECDTALRLANDLMKKYNLTMSQVHDKTEKVQVGVKYTARPLGGGNRWRKALICVFETLCEVQGFTQPDIFNPNITHVFYVGIPQDTILAAEMYSIFTQQIDRNSRHFSSNHYIRRSYAEGYVNSLLGRVRKLKTQRDMENEAGTAIIFVGKKKQAIDTYIKDEFKVKRKKFRPGKGVQNNAYNAGYSDGLDVDLGMDKRLNGKEAE
jgi:hypothetical protein